MIQHKAKQSLEKGLALFRAFGNHQGVHMSLQFLGRLARCTIDHREAQRRYEEALALGRAQGNKGSIAEALCELAYLANSYKKSGGSPQIRIVSLENPF